MYREVLISWLTCKDLYINDRQTYNSRISRTNLPHSRGHTSIIKWEGREEWKKNEKSSNRISARSDEETITKRNWITQTLSIKKCWFLWTFALGLAFNNLSLAYMLGWIKPKSEIIDQACEGEKGRNFDKATISLILLFRSRTLFFLRIKCGYPFLKSKSLRPFSLILA